MNASIISPIDYSKNIHIEENKNIFGTSPAIDLMCDRSNIILSGMTRAGKTTLLHTILNKFILSQVDPHNIIIFSKTAKDLDESYVPLIRYIADNTTGPIKIFESVDTGLLDSVIARQKKKKISDIYNSIFENRPLNGLDKWLILFDDIIGDAELKSF
jgi:hypothetical protein